MPIVVTCECGRIIKAPDHLAGKLAACTCGAKVRLVESTAIEFTDEAQLPKRLPKRAKLDKQREQVFRGEEGAGDTTAEVAEGRRKKRVDERKKKRRNDGDQGPRGGANLIDGLLFSLRFPLRRECLGTVIVLSVLYGTFVNSYSIMALGTAAMFSFRLKAYLMILSLLALGYLMYFLLQVLRAASANEQDLPMATDFDLDEIRGDLWCSAGAAAASFGPLLVYVSNKFNQEQFPNPFIGLALFCAGWFYFPMAILAVGLHHSILAANPITVAQGIWRVLPEYLVVCVISGSVILVTFITSLFIPGWAVVSGWVTWFLVFYAMTSTFYALGNLYFRNAEKLDWFAQRKPSKL